MHGPQRPTSKSRRPLAVLPCDKCNGRMEAASLMPGLGAFADRVFVCGQCAYLRVLPADEYRHPFI
jgi:hypothetical protein